MFVLAIVHFPECITECKGPRMDYNGSDWFEKRNALRNTWGALHKVRVLDNTKTNYA